MRMFTKTLIEKFGNTPLVGIEIGVYDGMNAHKLLKAVNITKLYLVDVWDKKLNDKWAGRCEREEGGFGTEGLRLAYEKVEDELGGFSNVQIFKGESHLIVNNFKDAIFDFIYIDAAHTSKAVQLDCEVWYCKLKEGGLFGGHDYVLGAVRGAVNGFSEKQNKKVVAAKGKDKHDGTCWWLV